MSTAGTSVALRRDTPAGPARVVTGLRTFLGGWLGIGRLVVGMARPSYDLQLTRYGEGWRATFYPAGRGHSVTSAVGSAWERELWIAEQPAASETLRKREAKGVAENRRLPLPGYPDGNVRPPRATLDDADRPSCWPLRLESLLRRKKRRSASRSYAVGERPS